MATSPRRSGERRSTSRPSARPYASSEVTRLLCVGAHVDPAFSDAVIRELVSESERFVAPSFGFDVLPVLGHALVARDRRSRRRVVVILSPLIPVFLYFFGTTAFATGVVLWLWATWAAICVERLVALHILTTDLADPKTSRGRRGFDGRIPIHPTLTAYDCDRINAEQDSTSGLVYYSGYDPFIGAGNRQNSSKFPILLNKARNPLTVSLDGGSGADEAADVEPFSAGEIFEYVQERLEATLKDEGWGGQQIEGLDISRRWYRTAVGPERPESPADAPFSSQGAERYDSAREYLCVRIGSWGQEVVASAFINFDVKGRTLYTEFHRYVLPPLNPSYRAADRLSPEITDGEVCLIAGESIVRMAREAVGAVLLLVVLPYRLWSLVIKRDQPSLEDQVEPGIELPGKKIDAFDYGARSSIRELAHATKYHHFFQSVDAGKYGDIIERRFLEIVIDFLEKKGMDTGEFRARQATILNYGMIQTGSGTISNAGQMAAGTNASASASAS
jgi:hypothetical protein